MGAKAAIKSFRSSVLAGLFNHLQCIVDESVPAIALPRDGSLVGIPFAGSTMRRTVALAQRGDRTLARPARALAEQLVRRHGAAVGGRTAAGAPGHLLGSS